tara:strand:- start:592 stop:804 length:213 start_codon:yes stop_codon:yes gene_type:complete
MFKIRTKDEALLNKQTKKLDFSFMDKMRLITNCCPEAKKRRFMEKGAKKLEKEFDLMDLIMEHRHLHHHN